AEDHHQEGHRQPPLALTARPLSVAVAVGKQWRVVEAVGGVLLDDLLARTWLGPLVDLDGRSPGVDGGASARSQRGPTGGRGHRWMRETSVRPPRKYPSCVPARIRPSRARAETRDDAGGRSWRPVGGRFQIWFLLRPLEGIDPWRRTAATTGSAKT